MIAAGVTAVLVLLVIFSILTSYRLCEDAGVELNEDIEANWIRDTQCACPDPADCS